VLRFVLAVVVAALALAAAAEAKPIWRHYPPYIPLPTRFIAIEQPSGGPVWRHYRVPALWTGAAETTAASEAPPPLLETAALPISIAAPAAESPPMPEPVVAAEQPGVVAAEAPATTPAQAPEPKPATVDVALPETPGSSDPRGQILLGLFFSGAVLAAIFFLGRRGFRRA
jgi:hypothetical protein